MFASLKCFVAEKMSFSSTSTQILKSVCVPGHYFKFKVCCRSKSRISHSIVGFQKMATDKKTKTRIVFLQKKKQQQQMSPPLRNQKIKTSLNKITNRNNAHFFKQTIQFLSSKDVLLMQLTTFTFYCRQKKHYTQSYNSKNIQSRIMVLVHETLSYCALQLFLELSLCYSIDFLCLVPNLMMLGL